MKQVLITGAAGFLGSNLAERLVSDGYFVIGVDNLISGREKNLMSLKEDNFKFVKADITKDLPKEITSNRFHSIFNLACPASPPFYQKYPLETLEVCSRGVKNMLELAERDKAIFLHSSTSEVYGDPEVHPQPESYWGSVNSYGPRAMYDEGKRYAEALIWVYKSMGVDTRIFRIFNTYGPNMRPDDGRVITAYITEALKNEPITVFGDGSQTRSFCFVSDLVEGMVRMLETKVEGPINLGNPAEFTMNKLAGLVLKLTESKSKIINKPLPINDPRQRKPDISKARKLLSWEPKVSLEDGLLKTIAYLREELA